jgi:hypothetical protein
MHCEYFSKSSSYSGSLESIEFPGTGTRQAAPAVDSRGYHAQPHYPWASRDGKACNPVLERIADGASIPRLSIERRQPSGRLPRFFMHTQ